MIRPRSAHIGAIGEGWVVQTFASAGVGTARPSVDLDGIDLVAWVVEDGAFRSAPLQIKATSDGNITLYRTKYPDYLGMLYVMLAPSLTVDAAYLIPQAEAREIGSRAFGHTSSWASKSNTYRGPFARVAEHFEGFEFTASTAVECLHRVIDPLTCVGSVAPAE